jgi:hypothetical protein
MWIRFIDLDHIGPSSTIHDGELVEKTSSIGYFFEGIEDLEVAFLWQRVHAADKLLVLLDQVFMGLLD